MTSNPFGKYSEILTTIITAFIVVTAVFVHIFPAFATVDSQFLDAAAWIALGAIFGKVSAANGYAQMAIQAHTRLDLIGAPPANDGQAKANNSSSSSTTVTTTTSTPNTPSTSGS